MGLLLNHPELPSCADCQKYLYSDKWEPTTKGGQPVPRPKGVGTPCYRCPKIPKGTEPRPENAVVLSARNHAAWRYYLQCLVDNRGILPQDRLTVRNNSLMRWVDDQSRRNEAMRALPLLLMGRAAARPGK